MATALAHAPGIGPAVIQNFALRPVATIGESKLWNVVTGGFLEINPFSSLINVVLFLTMGKWIEASWGGRHLLLFLFLINTLSAICTNVIMFAAYIATRTGLFMYVVCLYNRTISTPPGFVCWKTAHFLNIACD